MTEIEINIYMYVDTQQSYIWYKMNCDIVIQL